MSDRRDGWYWIKESHDAIWEAANWEQGQWCGDSEQFIPAVIGHRIPSPDEAWQCVPKEPTEEMLKAQRLAIMNIAGGYDTTTDPWSEMIALSPSPDDAP